MAEGRAIKGGGAPPVRRENSIIEPGDAGRGELQLLEERVQWENDAARLLLAEVRLPGREGKTKEQFRLAPAAQHDDGIVVVPIDEQDRIILVRQFRHPIRMWVRELPRGARDRGESPEEGARRELREEIGYELVESWPLGRMAADSGQLRTVPWLLVARVRPGAATDPDDSESIDATWAYTFSDLARACASGDILDSFTLSAVTRLLPHFDGDRFEYRAGVVR
ncbi:MAG TPA: NUDIX hydrolase [Gemmatimonadaceae bacterium]|nr:NUDIX hydrolase [Gemmatimonadaceae bacterium]